MSIRASRTIAGVAAVVILAAGVWYMKKDTSFLNIATYEECVEAGYLSGTATGDFCSTPDGRIFSRSMLSSDFTAISTDEDTGTSSNSISGQGYEDRIQITSVSAGQEITSPLVIEGEARGSWYFEASFPVRLLDGNGQIIAQMPVQALGEWMTSEFVPFRAVLTFAKPSTATGTLILHNDNPSGLPENDRFMRIPVRF